MAQPTTVIAQPTTVIARPTNVMAQPTNVMAQPTNVMARLDRAIRINTMFRVIARSSRAMTR
jgi:hypothetical protein